MSTERIKDYVKLSPKALLILAILLRDYESGNDGLTRRQIADALGQYRLYPHDDKAIKRLDLRGLIGVTITDKRSEENGQLNEYGFVSRNHISLYTRYHLHWLNDIAYETARGLLADAGLYQSAEERLVEGARNGLLRVFHRFVPSLFG
jgi:hypothetical protein